MISAATHPKNTLRCDLCQSAIGPMGVETESFGDSNGVLKDIVVLERYCDRNGV